MIADASFHLIHRTKIRNEKNKTDDFNIWTSVFGCNQANTFSKGQSQTIVPKDTIKSEAEVVIDSYAPSKIVRTIIQDRKGNIWMASWEGIIRYDGKSFTRFTTKDGLLNYSI